MTAALVSGAPVIDARERTLESLGRARELAPYQDQPRQMRAGAVGKSGLLRLGFERRATRTVLARMERRVPLMAQRALYWDRELPGMACVTIIHTSGSVLQGDRSVLDVHVDAGAQAHLTTQAATKVHEMDANHAIALQDFTLGHDAYLEYLPGATIPHRHARYLTDTRVVLPEDATALLSEVVLPGRKHHGDGELFDYDVFSSTVAAERPDGTRLMTERILVEPGVLPVRATGVMGTFDVFGTVFVFTARGHSDFILDRTTAVHGPDAPVVSGATRLPNDAGVVFRVLGREAAPVKRRIREFWGTVREVVTGACVPAAFLWQ